jgi:hypothetical protein
MPIGKALYAIRNAIKSSYSYGKEQSLQSTIARNICISNLNRLYSRYSQDGWQIPQYEIEDWELEEEYNTSRSSDRLSKAVLHIMANSELEGKDTLIYKELESTY